MRGSRGGRDIEGEYEADKARILAAHAPGVRLFRWLAS
jgi:hypothetical protein